MAALDSFANVKPSLFMLILLLLGEMFPQVLKIPTKYLTTMKTISASLREIAGGLIASAKEERSAGVSNDKSIIGTLSMLPMID